MENLYPPGPISVPDTLRKPTAAYKRHAWLAVAGLLLFVLAYFSLAGWFVWTAYRMFGRAFVGGGGLGEALAGACAAFLAIFMLKALFFVKHGSVSEEFEIKPKDHPRLFEFLHRLADEAGAPRPHRVFVSTQVNAGVFYDLSILNLLFPSKKNLEIGLGLVNVLSLGELKAVLAHEFGHFAQRTMAVGRWVYIAQQIAAHIVARRDLLDAFLARLSNFDLRVAWIGWLLSLIIWAIRSLVETAFSLVVLTQRVLAREMEMQADLVAVSLTGSDALIHALHRLQAADEAWAVTLFFLQTELTNERATSDAFTVQARIIEHLRVIRDDPAYGCVPALPAEQPEAHRVFRAEIAHPPRMWSTHPLNHEREENAKRVYIPASVDERSAWELFDEPARLREKQTARMYEGNDAARTAIPVPIEKSLEEVDREFTRTSLSRPYRGIYLGRSVVLSAERPTELYAAEREGADAELDALYSEAIGEDLEQWRNLAREKSMLESLRDGAMAAPNGVIRHRGSELQRQELPRAIAELEAEIAVVELRVRRHDRQCRTAHREAAAKLGRGWEAHLVGLASVLHYADHNRANLQDATRYLGNTFAVVTATGRVNSAGLDRLLTAAREMHRALGAVFGQRGQLVFDATLAARIGEEKWRDLLEEFTLPTPTEENINEWMNAISSWCEAADEAFGRLSHAALDQLLESEAKVAAWHRAGAADEDAPAPPFVPAEYPIMPPGRERELQTTLNWWARFQNAMGIGPAIARFAAASLIVGGVFFAGASLGETTLTVYNGFGRPVRVEIAGEQQVVDPFGSVDLALPSDSSHQVTARTLEGEVIETFTERIDARQSRYVYNVAAAGPLIEWTALYGRRAESGEGNAETRLGARLWGTTEAEVLFRDPPQKIQSKSGSGSKRVLTGLGENAPDEMLSFVSDAAERTALTLAHARWEPLHSPHLQAWLSLAAETPQWEAVLAARLQADPEDILALRAQQNAVQGEARAALCAKARAQAEASPDNPTRQYLAMRCLATSAERDRAFLEGHRKWPGHAWLAYAAGHAHAGQQRWREAAEILAIAMTREPALAAEVAVDLARIRRVLAAGGPADFADLVPRSRQLRGFLAVENDESDPSLRPYRELFHGRLAEAAATASAGLGGSQRLLRLAAASDGAGRDLIDRALALPGDQDLDLHALWAGLGLAARQRADLAPYLAPLQQARAGNEDVASALRFIDLLRNGAPPAAAEAALAGLPLQMRGHALVFATVFLGERTPPRWRNLARQLLFVPERPFLK
ncbi:MAG: M48 family metallopeptidase [Blastocatellia bacterium]|nr:M48 family metallopeptidase [Blastocatellia bacterium]